MFDPATQNTYLGDTVRAATGVDYRTALSILHAIIRRAVGDGTAFNLPLLNLESVASNAAEALNVTTEAVALVVRGFTIAKAELENDPRHIWQPKHEHRAFRRGFFECPHPGGSHIMFSERMAMECLAILAKSTVFGQLPMNWRGAGYKEALSRLSNASGKWFGQAWAITWRRDIHGVIGAAGIGSQQNPIPSDIGELDYVFKPEIRCSWCWNADGPQWHRAGIVRDDISFCHLEEQLPNTPEGGLGSRQRAWNLWALRSCTSVRCPPVV